MTTATLEPRALPCVGRALLSRAALHPVLLKGTPPMKSTLTCTMHSRNGKGEHAVKHDFVSVPDMYAGMVDRIVIKIHDLQYGKRSVTDSKAVGREIRGMITLLECVADAPTMHNELLDRLSEAHAVAISRK